MKTLEKDGIHFHVVPGEMVSPETVVEYTIGLVERVVTEQAGLRQSYALIFIVGTAIEFCSINAGADASLDEILDEPKAHFSVEFDGADSPDNLKNSQDKGLFDTLWDEKFFALVCEEVINRQTFHNIDMILLGDGSDELKVVARIASGKVSRLA